MKYLSKVDSAGIPYNFVFGNGIGAYSAAGLTSDLNTPISGVVSSHMNEFNKDFHKKLRWYVVLFFISL